MGDPVCWLDRTCPSCGALWEGAEEEREGAVCPRCGEPLDPPA